MTDQLTAAACACCGREAEAIEFATLHCRPDISVCGVCAGWLVEQNRLRQAATDGRAVFFRLQPMFAVTDMKRSLVFYASKGFDMETHDENYAFAERDDIALHLVSGADTIVAAPSAVYIHVDDVDALAAEWGTKRPENMDYGLREAKLVDPDGNVIRFGSPPA